MLASGDPFHYGVGDLLMRAVPADETLCLPQPSAFSLAAARLGWSLQDVSPVSLHGRALEGIVRHLQPGARILALSWDGETPAKLAALLTARGFGDSTLTVLERMGGPGERVRRADGARASISTRSSRSTPSRWRSSRAGVDGAQPRAGPRRQPVRA